MTAWQATVKDDRIPEAIFEVLSSRTATLSKQFDQLWTDYIILHMEFGTYTIFSLRFE